MDTEIPWEQWLPLLFFAFLTIYLHSKSVNLTTHMNYSPFTATIFPVIYLFGTSPAMLMSVIAGLVDGI